MSDISYIATSHPYPNTKLPSYPNEGDEFLYDISWFIYTHTNIVKIIALF